MPEFDRIREIKARVQGSLFAVPGVHAVGIGPKVVNGRPTGEPAIIAFVKKKRPVASLTQAEIIPPAIEHVKTDVVESPVPRLRQGDSAQYPELRGGIQIAVQKLGVAFGGTLGCIARTDEPTPKIVLITCHHVVAGVPHAAPTNLVITRTQGQPEVRLSGSNTPGTLVNVTIQQIIDPDPDVKTFDVMYVTKDGDSLTTITLNLAGEINSKLSPSVTATADAVNFSITFAAGAGVHGGGLAAATYGPHPQDPAATIHVLVHDASLIQPPTVTFTGQATSDVIAVLNLNPGGARHTKGTFTLLQKGDTAEAAAQRLAGSITALSLPGVTVTRTGAQISIDGLEEVECDIFDRRVGQPTPTFPSAVCQCLDQSIGKVISTRVDLDAAMVELKPGTKYRAAIEGIGAVAGSYVVQLSDILDASNNPKPFAVRKRGRVTLLQPGNITALHVDGINDDSDVPTNPVAFARFYTNAMTVVPTGVGPNPTFSAAGDSGAAVVRTVQEPDAHGHLVDTHYIVGILFSGVPASATSPELTFVTPFDDISTGLQVALETSTDPDETRTVPAAPHVALAIHPTDTQPGIMGALQARIGEAERQLSAIPAGEEYVLAVRRHATEAARLINTNRRVATAWHRNRGPRILQSLLESLCSPQRPMPANIDGQSVGESLRRIQDAFARYGDAAMVRDFSRLADRLTQFAGLTYPQMLAALHTAGGD